MALAGVHIECGKGGSEWTKNITPAVRGTLAWSENLTVAGTTALPVPGTNAPFTVGNFPWIISISAAVDAWISIGPSPNASANPRRLVGLGSRLDVIASPGDFVAYLPA